MFAGLLEVDSELAFRDRRNANVVKVEAQVLIGATNQAIDSAATRKELNSRTFTRSNKTGWNASFNRTLKIRLSE